MTRDDADLPVARAADLEVAPKGQAWLVESIWSHLAVGFLAGQPKCTKTWMALDLAVSVASGTPCLGTFPVAAPGPVLVYLAEDALPRVRERILAISAARGVALDGLDLHVITAPCLRLDEDGDRGRLVRTVEKLRPRLLVLDPLVRLWSGDENNSGEVSALLGFLRTLAREHDLALVVVHHMSKKARKNLGQALRGSSDLHAWSDSSAYLTRRGGHILCTLEHRAAPAPEPILLALVAEKDGVPPHLERVVMAGDLGDDAAPAAASSPPALATRLRVFLRDAGRPLSRVALRRALRVNNLRLGEALTALERDGALTHTADGWALREPARPAAAPAAAP